MKKIFLALILLGQVAFAQNKVAKDSVKSEELNEIVVTANRTNT